MPAEPQEQRTATSSEQTPEAGKRRLVTSTGTRTGSTLPRPTSQAQSDYELILRPRRDRLRKLPRLLQQTLSLVWSAGPRELVVTTVLQVMQGLGVTAQLLLGKRVLESVLDSGQAADGFGRVAPGLAALVALTVLLSFAAACRSSRAAS